MLTDGTTIYYSDFKTLRSAYIEVKTFLEKASHDSVRSLHTKIEADLGMAGDDNLELLEQFVVAYKLNPDEFNYSNHFLSEGELFNSWTALVTLLSLPIHVIIWMLNKLTFGRINLTERQLFPNMERATSDLSFGDMLAWYLTGHFIKRSDLRVVLNPITQ